MESFQVNIKELPVIVAIHSKDSVLNKYKYDFSHLNMDEISKWIFDLQKGMLQKFYQSEPIPEYSELSGVHIVVGKSFNSLVLGNTKNVLLQVYDPMDDNNQVLNIY